MKTRIPTYTLALVVTLSACGKHDDSATNDNSRTPQAISADRAFWDLMHGKDYQSFDSVLAALRSAQNENPSDIYTNAHIGWANFWAFSEGARLGVTQGAMALQYMQDAEQAFTRAAALAPLEPRIRGFLGYSRLALGSTMQDQGLLQQGQGDVEQSVGMWPEWAYFGAGYGLDARAPHDSPQFAQALNYYWANLDICANAAVDRNNPDWTPYLAQETLEGRDRACWDSWIAPYNLEGFFLIMGDALVKAGNTDAALVVYNNARLMKFYDSWPFRDLLERRIANVMDNVANFRQPGSPTQPADPETSLVVNTAIACAVCHRGDADAHYTPPAWVGETANEYPVPVPF